MNPLPAMNPEVIAPMVAMAICQRTKFLPTQLFGRHRDEPLAYYRQLGMTITMLVSRASTSLVARAWRRGDHSTVLHAQKRIKRMIQDNPELSMFMAEITNEVTKQLREMND